MNGRFLVAFGVFISLFFLIEFKLFEWQIVRADELSSLAKDQSEAQIILTPQRGTIYTSDHFPLATNRMAYVLFANPKSVQNKELASSSIAGLLDIDIASVSAQINKDKAWVPLAWHISDDTKNKIAALNLPGIGFDENPTRFYPEGSMAAQLVGFVGKDTKGEDTGYFGLEGYYDRQLKGQEVHATVVKDALNRPILAKTTDGLDTDGNGRDLTLSIDRVVQYDVEQKLKAGMDKYGAKEALAAVMDPKTGEILAMANYPSFDPSTFWEFAPDTYKNPFVTDTYEPGSTFKPLVMAYAIDHGLVSPQTQCDICAGPVTVGDYDIHTWNNEYHPNSTMIDVIKNSDNTGMVYVSKKLGLDGTLSLMKSFGIGDMTGIDLQGEAEPGVKDRESWYPIDVATASFGQGISVTPIELLSAFSSLANDGVRMQPHVVKEIRKEDGSVVQIPPTSLGQAVSSTTTKVMREILVNAVNTGEAKFARVHGYRIAGKTGTASIPVNGHYDGTKTIASFIGYAPADNPKFVMLVIFHEPTSSIYGAETAAPVFFDIARDLLLYYHISPTENE